VEALLAPLTSGVCLPLYLFAGCPLLWLPSPAGRDTGAATAPRLALPLESAVLTPTRSAEGFAVCLRLQPHVALWCALTEGRGDTSLAGW
jgi:hypothetical protein